MQKGKLYLIPNSLGSDDLGRVIPPYIKEVINTIDHYIVENIQTAAKFLKLAGINKPLRELTFYVLNAKSKESDITTYLDAADEGNDTGLISEAGLPCIADPGSVIVKMAHQKGIQVVPLSGPSSILLALMASGVSGQNFAFIGYLPIDKNARAKKIKGLGSKIKQEGQTQIFIEAPHRNDKLLVDILSNSPGDIILSISKNLTMETEEIITGTIEELRSKNITLGKEPVIFVMGK
ncbi:MAG TPA: SAM-dependent methyltransferase [Ignavibacteria bacterium]|nr:SAM-dependent methyltransferase [Ignavibacteria bacterium]HMQ97873.1 SAM-dependent methyltransferase [Ignavibacteria bacterium]